MKIMIVGSGVVGKATGKILHKYGMSVVFYDIDRGKLEELKNDGYEVTYRLSDVEKFDLSFVCIPAPTIYRNLYDVYVKQTVLKIDRMAKDGHTIAIRSTVLPSTLAWLKNRIKKARLLVNPEFLRSEYPEQDFENLWFTVIGHFHEEDSKPLVDVYKRVKDRLPDFKFILVGVEEACLIKYAWNCLLATKISFYNEMKQLFEAFGIDIRNVVPILYVDSIKTEEWYKRDFLSQGFQDECLPKDLATTITLFERLGLEARLLRAVEDVNRKLVLKRSGEVLKQA